ncbi:transmembrane protein [Anaeramoeba ignava]|uniref:Transmembrane protein n=1 Tax=Anaeramoeba ignava TaxID=1746090 RepID=A0A9Q0R5W3_ANAIG|nr:transmembrane protein [Anaeramoeba ignava]
MTTLRKDNSTHTISSGKKEKVQKKKSNLKRISSRKGSTVNTEKQGERTPRRVPKIYLEKAIEKIDTKRYENLLGELRSKPDKDLENLETLVNFFEDQFKNAKLSPQQEEKFQEIERKMDLPISLLNPTMVESLHLFMSRIPMNSVGNCLKILVERLVDLETSQNSSPNIRGFGIRMIIQIILRMKNLTFLKDAQFREFIMEKLTFKNTKIKKKSQYIKLMNELVWFLAQFIRTEGFWLLQTWLEFVTPIILNPDIPLESILNLCKLFEYLMDSGEFSEDQNFQEKISPPYLADFLLVMESLSDQIAFLEQNSIDAYDTLQTTYQEDVKMLLEAKKCLDNCLPEVEKLSLFSKKTSPHVYFKALLQTISLHQLKKSRIIDYLIEIIHQDPNGFKQWKQDYPSIIPQSNLLLEYILRNFSDLKEKLDSTLLLATIQKFILINTQILTCVFPQNDDLENTFDLQKIRLPEVKQSTLLCKKLKKQLLSKFRLPKKFNFWILSFFVGFILFAIIFWFTLKIFKKK